MITYNPTGTVPPRNSPLTERVFNFVRVGHLEQPPSLSPQNSHFSLKFATVHKLGAEIIKYMLPKNAKKSDGEENPKSP